MDSLWLVPEEASVPDIQLANAKRDTNDHQADFDDAIESSGLATTLGTRRVLSAAWD